MAEERVIFHVDVNSAFLSWSAEEILRQDPSAVDLRTIPSAVTGDRESRHGVILAKSIPAKRYRVMTGEPTVTALRKCPDLVLINPDFRVYNRNSKAFIGILREYAPVVEQVSIDEAYCDMTGTRALYGDLVKFADRLRNDVRKRLGFTVNVGVSVNKLLAKMASDFEKPDRTHTLFPDEIPTKMWPLPIGELYGVGRAGAEKLTAHGLLTIGDAAVAPVDDLTGLLGKKAGESLHRAANGLDDSPVSGERAEEKSVGNSTTLSEDLTARNREGLLRPTLLALSDSVGSRLRAGGHRGCTIAVTIRTSDFRNHTKQTRLDEATDSTEMIFRTALELIDEVWDGRRPVRLIGLTVSSLTAQEEPVQMSLFADEAEERQKERERRLDQMTDTIRKDFGKGAIVRGSLLHNEGTENIGRKQDP